MTVLRTIALLALVFCVSATPARALGDRVAVVIGNAAYLHGEDLANPLRDARAVGARLRDLGYRVYMGEDVDRAGFTAMLANLQPKIAGAETVVFYYAGHGVQIDGTTYLLPTDARMQSRADLVTAVALNEVLDALQLELRANVVFIDSCRNNPIYAARTRSFGPAAQEFDPPSVGTFIGYASQPGAVALDGDGEHSPFTRALLDHIGTPGIGVEELMRRVRLQTVRETGGAQVPWSQSSLLGPVELVPPPAVAGVQPAPPWLGPAAASQPNWTHARAARNPFSLGEPVAVPGPGTASAADKQVSPAGADAGTRRAAGPTAASAPRESAGPTQPGPGPVARVEVDDGAMQRRRMLRARLCMAIEETTGPCADVARGDTGTGGP